MAQEQPLETVRRRGPRTGVRFSNRFAELISERGMSSRLASAVGVDPAHITRLARGEVGCNHEIAVSIAQFLGVSLEDIRA